MTFTIVLPLSMGFAAVLCCGAAAEGDGREETRRKPTRVYTNDDLDRVRPYRGETGATSEPAVRPDEREALGSGRASRAEARERGRGEEYWRREARRVRERIRALADQAEALRARIAAREQERRRVVRRGRAASAWGEDGADEVRLAALERRMRQLDEDLADRARRAGALPGWLRE